MAKEGYAERTKDHKINIAEKKKRLAEIEKKQEQFLRSASETASSVVRMGYEKQIEKLEE